MEYDKDGDLNLDAWYNKNRQYLPGEFQKSIDEIFEISHFLLQVYVKVMRQLNPALKKLMLKQYPFFKTEKRPLVVDFINNIASTTGYSMLLKLYKLVHDQKAGVNVREKYPDFDKLIEFYGRPHHPDTVEETSRNDYYTMSDKEWEEFRDSENKSLLEFFNWQETRKFEFVDLVQSIVLKYYKELDELNADELILYAAAIIDEYDYYLGACDYIELFIDCGFPEEDMKLTDPEFQQKYSELSQEVRDKADELRNRRIAGECNI